MTDIITAPGANCQTQGSTGQNNTSEITTRDAYNQLLNTSVEMAYLDTMISLSHGIRTF